MPGDGDPPPFESLNPNGRCRALLVCDHASCAIPAALGTLGVSEERRRDHIGWDIGAAPVARRLSALLDAQAILAGYSRLVVDCNRPESAPDRIPEMSDSTPVPGNQGLSPAARDARIAAFFTPYHEAIRAALDRRAAAGPPPALVAVHSFTPHMADGIFRPWHIAICWHEDRRMAAPMAERLSAEGWQVGENQPFSVDLESDYTLPVHGEQRGVPSLLIEIRNDLVREPSGVEDWSMRLAGHIRAVLARPEIWAA